MQLILALPLRTSINTEDREFHDAAARIVKYATIDENGPTGMYFSDDNNPETGVSHGEEFKKSLSTGEGFRVRLLIRSVPANTFRQ